MNRVVGRSPRSKAGNVPRSRWPGRARTWLGHLRWPGDFALPVVVGVVQVAGSYFSDWHRDLQPGPGGWALLVVGPLALVVRRRHPVAALSVAFAATLGPPGTTTGFLSLIVAFFVAATSGHRRAAWASIAAGFVWSVWLAPLVYQQKAASASFALALGAWLVVLVVVAEAVRMARERRAERQSARELEARRLASEERLRMARDLHDMIGHNISLISIQAGVGLDLMEDQPEQARAALVAIKAVSKEALGELRAMLNALRRDDDDVPRSPAPGLDRLDELVQLTRAAGLSVTTEVVGMPHPLPASVDLAGYRIVQESLTNVARHAPGATATVRIAYKEGAVVVEVVDDGGPSVGNAGPSTGNCGTGTGSGIAGMKERARALGGDLVTRPRPHGGFEVRARLPLDEIQ
jgi:signal transduction histidine kinase